MAWVEELNNIVILLVCFDPRDFSAHVKKT